MPLNNVHRCRACGDILGSENWYSSSRKHNSKTCISCMLTRARQRYKDNTNGSADQIRQRVLIHRRLRGERPMGKNQQCASYLGVHIAEQVLSNVFKDVKLMPYGYSGFDFICNHGKKIDVKSSCMRGHSEQTPFWQFNIQKNTTADYFLCIAFDNRQALNPLYAWLLPGTKFNMLCGTGISETTIQKWDEYRISVDRIIACCDKSKTALGDKQYDV